MPAVDEQAILDTLRRIPPDRWEEVLHFLGGLTEAGPEIRTGEDLSRSGLVGAWADRDDIGGGREFARSLRRRAETVRGADDAPGH